MAATAQLPCRDSRGVVRPSRATASGCSRADRSCRVPSRFSQEGQKIRRIDGSPRHSARKAASDSSAAARTPILGLLPFCPSCEISLARCGLDPPWKFLRFGLQLRIHHIWLPKRGPNRRSSRVVVRHTRWALRRWRLGPFALLSCRREAAAPTLGKRRGTHAEVPFRKKKSVRGRTDFWIGKGPFESSSRDGSTG